MNIYFSSEFPCAVKLGGAFLGLTEKSLLQCKVTPPAFVEICPTVDFGANINFILDDKFLSCPPKAVSVTDIKGAYLIKTHKNYADSGFGVIYQTKLENCTLTVFNENGVKISLDTGFDFYAEDYNSTVDSISAEAFTLSGKTMLAVNILGERNILLVFALEDKIKKIFCGEVTSFDTTSGLTITELHQDIAKHKVVTSWGYNNGELIKLTENVTTREGFDINSLHEKVIPYAFLEAFLVGDKIIDYLADSVLKNADKLGGYLGDYIGVFPPPPFRNNGEVGLIYKVKENVYKVEYYTFSLSNRKIENIKKSE